MSQAQEEQEVVVDPIDHEMVKYALRHVSLGIVLTPLSIPAVVDAIEQGKALAIEFLHEPELDAYIGLDQASADKFDVSMSFCRQVANFYDVKDMVVVSESSGIFDFTATYRWQEWFGYLSRLADKEERDFRFHVYDNGRANFLEVAARYI